MTKLENLFDVQFEVKGNKRLLLVNVIKLDETEECYRYADKSNTTMIELSKTDNKIMLEYSIKERRCTYVDENVGNLNISTDLSIMKYENDKFVKQIIGKDMKDVMEFMVGMRQKLMDSMVHDDNKEKSK